MGWDGWGEAMFCSRTVRPEGSSLVPASVCFWCVFVLYSTYTRAMQRWECGSVKEWFCPFCISASGALSSAWMEVWRVTVGEKGAALFKAGFTHSSVPIWDTVPSLSPLKHLWLGQLHCAPPFKKRKSAHPTLLDLARHEECGQPDRQRWLILPRLFLLYLSLL